MAGELHGKVAVVTGASTGIGRATALALAGAGASVVVHYARSRDEAEAVVRQVKDLGMGAVALQADFRDRAAIAAFAEAAEAHWGHVDALVNNAGMMEKALDPRTQGGDFGSHLERWDDIMNVNLRAPYELTWRLARGMVARKGGCVVNVASVAGMYALTDAPLYSLSKAALLHFTRQAALMYAPHVRVNGVAPGWTETGFGPERHILDPEFQKAIVRHIPMRRLASPEEMADAILSLVAGSPYVTGHTLVVDGGMVAELR
ncbi:MAG: 3-oxoacyl-[acyl-carrier protein] reductase [Thermoplasmata archaeon]|nr:3-oxoacyl-[acyl-carrier protein] reductase [Thermoplasmata archaeon]